MRFHQSGIILFTEHYETTLAFYVHQLGLKLRYEKERLSVLDFGGSYLMIEDGGTASHEPKSRAQNPTCLRLDITDFADEVESIRERGVQVAVHAFHWGTIGVLHDPEGNRIELKDALVAAT